MNNHSKIHLALAAAFFGCASVIAVPSAMAQQTMAPDTNVTAPDNTGINKLDRNGGGLTADRQGSAQQDRDLTRQVRKAIMADKGLSSYAHNVKVITQGGIVTLKGPVRSDSERQAVLNAAMQATNGSDVTDQMSIAPKK